MEKSDVKIGMRVTCKERVEAYYSGYAGNPKCYFEPGMIGIVGAVDVPSVRRKGVSFCCVDFTSDKRVAGENTQKPYEWRCSLLYDNIRILK